MHSFIIMISVRQAQLNFNFLSISFVKRLWTNALIIRCEWKHDWIASGFFFIFGCSFCVACVDSWIYNTWFDIDGEEDNKTSYGRWDFTVIFCGHGQYACGRVTILKI